MTTLRISLLPPARERWTAIGLVTLIALLAYGPLVPWLGFYRDDWYQIWAGTTLGPRSIITLFSIDRPVMGYTYAATFFFLRDSVLAWQLYALLLRWLGALGALWLFRKLWPGQPFVTTSAALLFLVYPGFLQQPNANTFSNHLVSYTAEVLSLAATAEFLDTRPGWRRTGLTIFAVAGALTCWLLYEYMIGLETLRYFLLARHALKTTGKVNAAWLSRFLASAAPFLAPMLIFLFWRIFLFDAARVGVDVGRVLAQYGPSPVLTVFNRAVELIGDFVEAAFLAWAVPPYERISSLGAKEIVLGLLPSVVAVLAFLRYTRIPRDRASPLRAETLRSPGAGPDLILLGTVTTLGCLTPVILAGRDIRWSSAFDRYTLHATLGLAMLTVGLVCATIRARTQPSVLAALLGLSVLTHQANAYHWARFWEEQRQLWWQLSWRAPSLESGTVLMVNLPSQRYFEDYEIWGPANLIYAPGDRDPEIAAEVLAEETAPKVRLGLSETRYMRVLIGIPRDFRNTLIVDWPSRQACVHVLEEDQPESAVTSGSLIQSLASYSHRGQILTSAEAAQPPERIFGPEPSRGWCWYYQAATLARQERDWPRVLSLGEEARGLGLTPSDPTEWMPFFEAYLNGGNIEQGRHLAELIRADGLVAEQICHKLGQEHFSNRAAYLEADQMLCDAVPPEPVGPTQAPPA